MKARTCTLLCFVAFSGCVTPPVAIHSPSRAPTQAEPITEVSSAHEEAGSPVLEAETHEDTESPLRRVSYEVIQSDAVAAWAPDPSTPSGETSSAAAASYVDDSVSVVPSDGMTLEMLQHLAMQSNPALQQAAAATSQAAAIRTQVGLKPNPSIGYFGEEIGNDSTAGLHGAFVSQTFVRGGKLAWNRAVHGHDVRMLCWLADAQRHRIANDIRLQFYEALGAQKRLQLAREFRGVAAEGVSISKELVQAQEAARPDVLQSEVQLSEVDLEIQKAEYDFEAAWNELVAVVGTPELTPSILIGELATSMEDRNIDVAYAHVVESSPFLAAACAQVQRAHANLQRQRVQPIPNVNAQVGVGYDDGTGDEFANVQLSVPIPVHNQNQGNIRAAHAEYVAATQNLNRLKMQVRRDLARAMRAFQIAQAQVRQYETMILPKVGETLELMQTAQQAGQFDFLRVLIARRAYFDANLEYVAAQTELAKANTSIDGLLLTGGLDQNITYDGTDELRGSALNNQ